MPELENQYLTLWTLIFLVVAGIAYIAMYVWRSKKDTGTGTHIDEMAGDEGED